MPAYTLKDHNAAVVSIAAKVSTFHKSQTPFRINHGSTNSTRTRDPSTPQLQIAHLNHILSIDVATRTAIVEPNVPLDALLSESLKQGLMPPVVMEFPGITVGGGFSGASGESTSWKEGLFDCSFDEVEIILGNGDVVCATKGGKNADLFNAARCSLGTLGVVTLLKIRLTKAEDCVLVSYERKSSVKQMIDRIVELCDIDQGGCDFIEGLLYSKDDGVIITGRHMASTSPEAAKLSTQRFDRATDPWFYHHVKDVPTYHRELVPTQSYLFRYDRGAFWGGESLFTYFGLPNNWFTRLLTNPLTKTRSIYKMMLSTGSADFAIIQDLILPVETSEAFVDYVGKELKIWPLWVCPIRKKPEDGDVWGWPFWRESTPTDDTVRKRGKHNSAGKGELTLNFGVWGPAVGDDLVASGELNRQLEVRLKELHGMKVPYSAAFYTEEEFWTLYDRKRYNELRKKWHAEALSTVYDKIKRYEESVEDQDAGEDEAMSLKERILWIWPFGGLYQLYRVLFT